MQFARTTLSGLSRGSGETGLNNLRLKPAKGGIVQESTAAATALFSFVFDEETHSHDVSKDDLDELHDEFFRREHR